MTFFCFGFLFGVCFFFDGLVLVLFGLVCFCFCSFLLVFFCFALFSDEAVLWDTKL